MRNRDQGEETDHQRDEFSRLGVGGALDVPITGGGDEGGRPGGG